MAAFRASLHAPSFLVCSAAESDNSSQDELPFDENIPLAGYKEQDEEEDKEAIGDVESMSSQSCSGPIPLDLSIPKMDDIERQISRDFDGWVSNGGIWRPAECEAKVKVAFIIPFRNRFEQLSVFLRHMHPLLKKQKLDYRIFVVEQSGDAPFNRAMLFNVGFKEALKFDEYKCFIFHDVDLLPEEYRNKYNCNSSPRHMANAMDTFHYRLPYWYFFGGVEALSREHFELINGFSNIFWGWGGEDDNLYFRVTRKGLKLTRPAVEIGRYKMIKEHHTVEEKPPVNLRRVRDAFNQMDSDGLNSLQYNAKVIENRLYTLIRADLPYEHHTQDNVKR
ncbi:beta-1,4-galactosyltransferase 6-like [Porites lutea]|uniref:beta-1,4-galactosyltransferase 6-like n=1 Tax=Porites lutea TaxID=51062 RepID=UPI003CC551E4